MIFLKKHQGLMISMTLPLLLILPTYSIACSRSSELVTRDLHGWSANRQIHRIKTFALIVYVFPFYLIY